MIRRILSGETTESDVWGVVWVIFSSLLIGGFVFLTFATGG
jgi:hypothetical protein